MPWNPTFPDGNLSVKANETPGQQNTSYIETTQNTNHFWNISADEDGKHKMVQYPTPFEKNKSPATNLGSALEWVEYTAKIDATPTVELFWKRPAQAADTGGIQMTVNIAPTAATNGYTFLPGGIILQWGEVLNPGSGPTFVDFVASGNVEFPNALWVVQMTYSRSDGSSTGRSFWQDLKAPAVNGVTGFTYKSDTSNAARMYWLAIGN